MFEVSVPATTISEIPQRQIGRGGTASNTPRSARELCASPVVAWRVPEGSHRLKEPKLPAASQAMKQSRHFRPQLKNPRVLVKKRVTTHFFDLPRELRQTILDITYSDSIVKHRNYTDFLGADADSSDFSFSHLGCVLAHAEWVENIKGMNTCLAEDMGYVEGQWKKRYMLLNVTYIKQLKKCSHSIKAETRRRYTEKLLRDWKEQIRHRYYLRSRSLMRVQRRVAEVMSCNPLL
ncbi:hypothetical protein E2P81_ATG02255 [Venturia nashicola]|uniref:Uncharacterized protein n=1 Tax=Venturia nashicola TaxID=86259 RepID=A0A4Z1P685_9PEZI|nr:hypothetical protein E6O75_ATG02312 [Venturia nashicola]TLD35952.1 hypothetical protein E2P81_ATG02255 [Venturia nashicola]